MTGPKIQSYSHQNRSESHVSKGQEQKIPRPQTPQAQSKFKLSIKGLFPLKKSASSSAGQHVIPARTNDQIFQSDAPKPTNDVAITSNITKVNEGRDGAVHDVFAMGSVGGQVENAIKNADDPIACMDVLSVLKSLGKFNSVVDKIANIHPYAQAAWTILSFASQTISEQSNRDDNLCSLLRKMNEVYTFLTQQDIQEIESMKPVVFTICKQTLECSYFIRRYAQDRKFRSRFLFSDAEDCIGTYNKTFDELMQQFRDTRATPDTVVVVHRILDDLESLASEVDLNSMPYVSGAGLDTGKICLEDTRRGVLGEITDWINMTEDNTRPIFWLHGGAGTGKSFIAHTIADRFAKLDRLGSCYCFDRNEPAEERDKGIFTTIARDLADRDEHFRNALSAAIHTPSLLNIILQWRQMILQPAQQLSECMVGPIVIVIDALDESGDANSREPLLHIFSGKSGKGIHKECRIDRLPPNIRILLTSRPLPDIANALKNAEHVTAKSMDSIPRQSTKRDIRRYVLGELSDLEGMNMEKVSAELAHGSGGSFEWARLACAFVKNDNMGGLTAEERFKRVLTRNKDDLLDNIYALTLETIFPQRNSDSTIALHRFRSLMAQIISTAEPLRLVSLNSMRRHFSESKEFEVDVVIKSMGALLSGITDPSMTIRPLHASFPEFLSDKDRSGKFCVDFSGIHDELAFASLGVMKKQLRFNICKLPSSYLPNSEVPHLAEKIKENISPELLYSCRFWTYHLRRTHANSFLANEVKAFFDHERLLFWFEVLSLEKEISSCIPSLSLVLEWANSYPACQDIYDDALDAQKFLRIFGGAISLSTPHLYISALPFSPRGSRIYTKFGDNLSKVLRICQGHGRTWPVILVPSGVNSVDFSPDGKRLVSGSPDNIIRLWDAESGKLLRPPLEGHQDPVCSVGFSPDGERIVSGSTDKTIRLWNADTGEQLGPPLKGHQHAVISVGFCPDGKRVVSGSYDRTIRLWDATTGELLRPPLEGHEDSVMCVRFSPDGKRVVSGSEDMTIRLWDAETGEQSQPPFEGHQSAVWSVRFSPDGKRVISGSGDATIRLWDAETGEQLRLFEGHESVCSVGFSPDGKYVVSGFDGKTILLWDVETGEQWGPPLEGHEDSVMSVRFSPDGKRIVSGSCDKTIWLWDAKTGEPLDGHQYSVCSVGFPPDGKLVVPMYEDKTIQLWDAESAWQLGLPLKGHEDFVTSVEISPDGKRVVSGSEDMTIRLWDAETGEQLRPPFEGHQDTVCSVGFSPDGKHVVSGSDDKTIRLWDAETGEQLRPPLEGHQNTVGSVGFSPDGKHVVSGSDDKTIRLWDAETGEQIRPPLEGHEDSVVSVGFSPDGKRVISGSDDKTIRLWDATTGEQLGPALEGHEDDVVSVGFSSDGKYIVSGSTDTTIRLWDAETGMQLGPPLEGHQGSVWAVRFSPDGKRIISNSFDSILLWNVHVGKTKQLQRQRLIRFSSEFRHALFEPLELVEQVQSSSSFRSVQVEVASPGWVSIRSSLLFWVPPTYHPRWYPSSVCTIIPPPNVQLDLSNMAHGTSWNLCYRDLK